MKITIETPDGSIIQRTPLYSQLGNWGLTSIRYRGCYQLVNQKNPGSDDLFAFSSVTGTLPYH